jgi:S1-C subfamily serine protease
MRLSILILCSAISTSFAAQSEVAPTATVPAAAAAAGKDVVHQLNNAFAKVFETVAPSVVIIEISKKTDSGESSPFDDLFFQGRLTKTISAETQRGLGRSKAKGPVSSSGLMVTSSRTFT